MPFWVIQTMEIVVALIFVDISVHVNDGGLLIAGAIAFFGLAVTAQGPLGIFRICGPRLHLLLVTATAVVVALAPIVPALRPDIEGIIVLEFGAIGLIRVATLTQTAGSAQVPDGGAEGRTAGRTGVRTGRDRSVIDTTATEATSTPAAADPPSSPSHPQAQGAATTMTTSPGAAARWAGRMSGAAAASGRRVVTAYQPEAEAQVKRTIRGAGKLAARASAKLSPPDAGDDRPTS